MVVAGVVSVAVAIAAFFVGVLLVLVAAIVFTVAAVAALAITIGLLIVAFSLAAVLLAGPIILFVAATVFLTSSVLALAHRSKRRTAVRPVRPPLRIRVRRPRVRVTRPRPHRVLVPASIVRVRRVRGHLPGPLRRSPRVDQLEGATGTELEHV